MLNSVVDVVDVIPFAENATIDINRLRSGRGHRMAHSWRCLTLCSARECMRCIRSIYGAPLGVSAPDISFLVFAFLFLLFLLFFVFALFLCLCSAWSSVDVPLLFSCPAEYITTYKYSTGLATAYITGYS